MGNLTPEARQDHRRELQETSSLFTVQSVHLTLPHEFRGRSDRECQDLRLGRLGVPRPARICGSANFVSPRPARIADQADYGPLYLARAARVDLVSSGPAGRSG
ncbi:hypothetical protein L3X38_032354 [Prunus dulcis]|uniref:F-box family protein with DUF295 n=1 Tax=Prunus dulcis TaxID=3755 RepID=A0AAD4VG55_PRUDU|nr:hypothetical protein L3X38_032354 [Prunus dulcis]